MYKIRNNTLQHKQKQLKYLNIEIDTQHSILINYLKASQPTRIHEDDLKWINKFDKKFEKNLIEKHNKKIRMLKEKQTPTQSETRTKTKINSKITQDTSNVIIISHQ